MDQDRGEIAAQQAAILIACNQPQFTTFVWPADFQTEEDNAAKKEIIYTISNFWSMHSRQLSRFVNILRTDLKTSVHRMQTNAESWEISRQAAGHKINSHAADLNGAMERFINFMTSLTLESLRLEESRTRARAANREDNLAELESV